MSKKKTTEQFIEEARLTHGDKYDYSKVEYENNKKPVCIICPEHGEFWQQPSNHLHGAGCPKCAGNIKYTKVISKLSVEKNNSLYYDFDVIEITVLKGVYLWMKKI